MANTPEITLKTLANILLYKAPGNMNELLTCLGVDPADARAAKAAKEIISRLWPDGVGERLGVDRRVFRFPKNNCYYRGDSLLKHTRDAVNSGNWVSLGVIKMHLRTYLPGTNDYEISNALHILSNPWHKENQGRSLLRGEIDSSGLPWYQLVFEVPQSIIKMCESVWGKVPVPPADGGTYGALPAPDDVSVPARQQR